MWCFLFGLLVLGVFVYTMFFENPVKIGKTFKKPGANDEDDD